MDRIELLGLELDASVGVYEHEHHTLQRLRVDLEVMTPLGWAAAEDALERTVDYDRLAKICRNVVDEGHHQLIEVIGEKIATQILASWARVRAVRVRVEKPGAVPAARTVAISIERRRKRAP